MNNPLVQPDPGLYIWTIVTFLVLLALLAKFAWRPLLEALDERQESIRKALDDARKAKQELERLHAESAKLLAQARSEAEEIVSRSRVRRGPVPRRDEAEGARRRPRHSSRNAERQIELETTRALQQIRQEAVDISVGIASKLLQRNVSKEDNERLIEETFKQLETRAAHADACEIPIPQLQSPRTSSGWLGFGLAIRCAASTCRRRRCGSRCLPMRSRRAGVAEIVDGIRRVGWGLVLILALAGLRFVDSRGMLAAGACRRARRLPLRQRARRVPRR